MANVKLSAITASGSNLVSADTLVGVHSGTTDLLFSGTQIAAFTWASPTFTGTITHPDGVTWTSGGIQSPTLVTPTLGVAVGTSLALGGATIGSNSLAVTGITLLNAGISLTQVDKGSVGTGTVTFSAAASSKQKLTVTGSLTIAYSNWPASGTYGEVEVMLVNGGSATITWPTVSWLKGDGTNSTTFSSMGVTLQASGTNFVIVWSTDGGTTLYGKAA